MIHRLNFESHLAVAEHWLYLWADCLKAREEDAAGRHKRAVAETRSPNGFGSGAAYATGAPDRGMFRPLNDPRPMGFVFMQVEHLLGPPEGALWQFAHHVWSAKKAAESFRHPELESESRASLYRLRRRLVERLARIIAARAPETVTQAAVEEARNRVYMENDAKRRAARCPLGSELGKG